jgi:hypothetical protein
VLARTLNLTKPAYMAANKVSVSHLLSIINLSKAEIGATDLGIVN